MIALVVGQLGGRTGHFLLVQEEIFFRVDVQIDLKVLTDRVTNKLEVLLSVVRSLAGEEADVQVVQVMVDRTAAAVSSGDRDVGQPALSELDLLPRILVSADHDAWCVAPE